VRRTHTRHRGIGAPLSTLALILALAALLGFGVACSSSNPVEPAPDSSGGGGGSSGGGDGSGTYQIALSVTPTEVPVGGSGTLALTVTNRSGGPAPANGAEVTLNTNLGYFSLNDKGQPDQTATVGLVGGAGQTPIFGGDSTGTAEVIAVFDDSTASLGVTVTEPEAPPFFATSVAPDVGSGLGGQRVQITGAGFTSPAQVTFDDAIATVLSVTPEVITVRTPPAVPALTTGQTRRVNVQISIDLESSPRSTMLPGAYIYAGGGGPFNQPAIFSVSPSQGPNAGGTQVTILGEGFETGQEGEPPARVFFGFSQGADDFDGVEATVSSRSDSRLVVSTPPATGVGQALLNQTVDVQVANPRSGLEAVLKGAFQYGTGSGGGIRISGISPRRAPYTGNDGSGPVAVTLLGQGFGDNLGNLQVTLAGVPQGELDLKADAELEITALAKAPVSNCNPPSGPAVVTNTATGESGTSSFDFTYTVEQPRLTSLLPTSATEDEIPGTTVEISGSAFQGTGATGEAVQVTFDGVPGTGPTARSSILVEVQPPPFTGTWNQETCDDNEDGVTGQRDAPTPVDVVFTNLSNGCSATLVRGFTYEPLEPACDETTALAADFIILSICDRTVSVEDASTGTPNKWQWNFGDTNAAGGGTRSGRNASYTYSEDGTYVITLTVTNAAGVSATISDAVTVPSGISPGC